MIFIEKNQILLYRIFFSINEFKLLFTCIAWNIKFMLLSRVWQHSYDINACVRAAIEFKHLYCAAHPSVYILNVFVSS